MEDRLCYCTNCGHEIPSGDVYCRECGAKATPTVGQSNSSTQDVRVDPRMQKLRNYKETKECTCLECGYTGLMGVVGSSTSGIRRAVPWIIATLAFLVHWIFGRFGLFTNILSFIMTLMIFNAILGNWKKVLYCPNCDRKIIEK